MTINARHRECISRNISDNLIHQLQVVTNDNGEFITADAIKRRITAIRHVLAGTDYEVIPDDEDDIGFTTVNGTLDRFRGCLTHPCPQNFTKDEVMVFYNTQQQNLLNTQNDLPTDSLAVGNVEQPGDTSFTIETKYGATLSNQNYGLLGICIEDGRGEQITAAEVKAEISNAFEAVVEALEVKQKALAQKGNADKDIARICDIILRSDNLTNPKALSKESLDAVDNIVKKRSSEDAFRDAVNDINPKLDVLFPKQATNSAVGFEAEAESEEAKLDTAYAVSMSLGASQEGWDELKPRLLASEEERRAFYEIIEKSRLFNPKEISLHLDLQAALKLQQNETKSSLRKKSPSRKQTSRLVAAKDDYDAALSYPDILTIVIHGGEEESSTLKKSLLAADQKNGKFLLPEDADLLRNIAHNYGDNIAAVGDEINKPLLSKIDQADNFFRDEFTDHDVVSYSEHVFSHKYPQASIFADYAATGIVVGADILSNRMAETISNGKWGFFHYSDGGHWRLIAVSPQREVICLDSIGKGDKGSVPSYIKRDVESAFKKAKLGMKGDIKYYGLGTQRDMQCGLHSCLAMEEIVRSIVERNKDSSAEKSYALKAQRILAEYDIPTSGEISDRDASIFQRAKNSITEESQTVLLEELISTRVFTPEQRQQFVGLQKSLRGTLKGEVDGYGFGVGDILAKAKDSKDRICEKLSDQRIVEARVSAAAVQLDDYITGCFGCVMNENAAKILSQKGADKILPDFVNYSKKLLQASDSNSHNSQRSSHKEPQKVVSTSNFFDSDTDDESEKDEENSKEVGDSAKWHFSDKNETISPNSAKPRSKIKVLQVEPVLSSEYSVWFNSDRGNKFRVMKGVYGGNAEEMRQKIEEVFIGILQTIKDEIVKKSNGEIKLTKEQVVAIIDAAKVVGGISNKLNEDGKYVENEKLTKIAGVDEKIAKYFSARFQQESEKCGIYTGREDGNGGVEGVNMVGLRLTFIPDDVVDFVYNSTTLDNFRNNVREAQKSVQQKSGSGRSK